jgi:anti-anti-sigma factor
VLEDIYPVRWAGKQAVVTLPEDIDVSNAGQIREQLLSVINRGVAVLIADMTATVSCDYAGGEAIFRAYQRAVISGTDLRLVVTAQIVRRVLSYDGLDRLVSIYPSLEAAQDLIDLTRSAVTAEQAQSGREVLDAIINRLFELGLLLQAAIDLPADTVGQRIEEALGHLDDTIREIRDGAFTTPGQTPPRPSPP